MLGSMFWSSTGFTSMKLQFHVLLGLFMNKTINYLFNQISLFLLYHNRRNFTVVLVCFEQFPQIADGISSAVETESVSPHSADVTDAAQTAETAQTNETVQIHPLVSKYPNNTLLKTLLS